MSILPLFVFAGEDRKLTIQGQLMRQGEYFTDAKIVLFEQNQRVGSTEPNWMGKFEFTLGVNSHYTIEVQAENFVNKRVSFNTNVPEDAENFSTFKFDVEMLKVKKIDPEKIDIFDFPVGLVYYDEYGEKFRFNKEYTSKIRREFRKALDEEVEDLKTAEE